MLQSVPASTPGVVPQSRPAGPTGVGGGAPRNIFDPRSLAGILSRGPNIYEAGGSLGPPGAGRPRAATPTFTQGGAMTPAMNQAIQRRLSGYTERAADKSTKRWSN